LFFAEFSDVSLSFSNYFGADTLRRSFLLRGCSSPLGQSSSMDAQVWRCDQL